MRCLLRNIIPSAVVLVIKASALHAASPPHSVSTSHQFIVYGPDARLRGAICDLAEQTKKKALSLLDEPDAWKTPIIVHARLPEANFPEVAPARLDVSQTGFGLKLQLELRIDRGLDAPAIERELLRTIYLEMIYRARPDTPAGSAVVLPPEWLLEGTLALGDESVSSEVPSVLKDTLASGNVIGLEQFLRQQPALLESPSRMLYRAYAAALVSMLIEAPDGRARLARFVAHLPLAGNDLVADLKAHFPALGDSPETLQRNWTLAVARFGDRERYRVLNPEQTEHQLAGILRIEVHEADRRVSVYTLEEFPSFIRNPESAGALRGVAQQLLLLSARANPLYQPIIGEYQRITGLFLRRKTKGITERLAKVRGIREHVSRRMNAIADYMNWFEATQAHSGSGAFAAYMRAAELAAEPERRRRDPISVYLDALEAQMNN